VRKSASLLAIVLMTALAGTLAVQSGSAFAARSGARHCPHKYGYNSTCIRIPKHTTAGLHIPKVTYPSAFSVIRTGNNALDLVNQLVACPGTPPAHAWCFEVKVFNDATGFQVTHPPYGVTIQYPNAVYKWNGSTWSKLLSKHSATTGLFAVIK
jgi:hypothetical protein